MMGGFRRLLRLGILLVPAFIAGLINALARSDQAILAVDGQKIIPAPEFEPFWRAGGGLATFGPPIEPARLEDNILRQTFLNVELVLGASSQVSLAPLGWELGLAQPPSPRPDDPGVRYFTSTGHALYPGFSLFYDQLGGEAVAGPPIADVDFYDGRIIQYFSNLGLYREESAAPSEVQLLTLGLEARQRRIAHAMAQTARPETTPIVNRPFAPYLDHLGGESLLGAPVTEPHESPDGSLEQVYERAVLYAPRDDLSAVGLRAIGYRLGPVEPPVPDSGDPDGLYFEETGHNVRWAFAEFYRAHDGGSLLGLPLAEAELDMDGLLQRFENASLVYRYDLPAELAVQLAPLDQVLVDESIARSNSPTSETEAASESPGTAVVRTWVESPVLSIGSLQTIFVQVLRDDGSPCSGETPLVTVHGPRNLFMVESPPTDSSGQASLSLSVADLRPAEIVNYDVTLSGACGIGTSSGQFAGKSPSP